MIPRSRSVNGFAVNPQPFSHVPKALGENRLDGSILRRPNVHQQIAVHCNGRDKLSYQFGRSKKIIEFCIVAMTPTLLIDRHCVLEFVLLQNSGIEAIGARVNVAVFTVRAEPPTIVRHDSLANWTAVVEPSDKLFRLPVLVRRFPIAISPNDFRIESLDNLDELRPHFEVHVGLLEESVHLVVLIHPVEPLKERIVNSEFHRLIAHSLRQFFDDITIGPNVDRIPTEAVR